MYCTIRLNMKISFFNILVHPDKKTQAEILIEKAPLITVFLKLKWQDGFCR